MGSIDRIVERRILAAQEKGLFDNLPGAGRPLGDLGRPRDENWWLRQYMMREGINGVPFLPPALALRKEAEDLPAAVACLATERAVRDAVAALNRRIADALRKPSEGPSMTLMELEVETILAGWRSAREPVVPVRQQQSGSEQPPERRRRRIFGSRLRRA